MKRLIPLFMIVCLSGCAAVDAYLMTHFDPIEYRMITEIRYDAHNAIAECDDAVASKANAYSLAYKVGVYHTYELDIPHKNPNRRMNDPRIRSRIARRNTQGHE